MIVQLKGSNQDDELNLMDISLFLHYINWAYPE